MRVNPVWILYSFPLEAKALAWTMSEQGGGLRGCHRHHVNGSAEQAPPAAV